MKLINRKGLQRNPKKQGWGNNRGLDWMTGLIATEAEAGSDPRRNEWPCQWSQGMTLGWKGDFLGGNALELVLNYSRVVCSSRRCGPVYIGQYGSDHRCSERQKGTSSGASDIFASEALGPIDFGGTMGLYQLPELSGSLGLKRRWRHGLPPFQLV